MQTALDQIGALAPKLRALILGVTPELVRLRWPDTAEIFAIDSSTEMIRHHWTPSATVRSTVLHGSWESIPATVSALQVVLADGSLNILPNLDAIKKVIEAVRDVLTVDGLFVLRAFTRPDTAETTAEVIRAMLQGKIGSVHVAKWRLAMALHGTLADGVELQSIWKVFNESCERNQLSRYTGWSEESIATIDSYQGVSARYFFPTLTEFRELLNDSFREERHHCFDYELGERCPTLVLAPRKTQNGITVP
jgi:SAM-dependent methyltransferase